MTMSAELLDMIEQKTGESIEQLQAETLWERRRKIEARHPWRMRVIRYFPFIGRGSVMGEHLLSHEDVANEFDRAIR